jgi:multimeric flavodoxin WrbA
MKITVFNGSPRAEKGNTHFMVKEFLEGAQKAGAETEVIFLGKKKINHCTGCYTCWFKTPKKCVFQDDMAELLEKSMKSDIIVYACPVYVGSVPGIMKDFLDRHVCLAEHNMEKAENGVYTHVKKDRKQGKMVLISNCGFPEQIHFKYFKTVFEYIEMNGAAKIIAEIYRGEGPLLQVTVPELAPVIDNYKNLLRKAGKEVVENECLSAETKEELEKPLIPYDMYMTMGNKFFNERKSRIEQEV